MPPPALMGRLRPRSQGSGRHRLVLVRAHRQAADLSAGPAAQRVCQLGGALQGSHGGRSDRARHRARWHLQTERYTSGANRKQILFAMRHRAQIDPVLARYRTLDAEPDDTGPPAKPWPFMATTRTGPTARRRGGIQPSTGTAAGDLPTTPRPLSCRTLAPVIDITGGRDEQTLRILSNLDPAHPLASLEEVRPPLTRVETWVQTQLPPRPAHGGAGRARHAASGRAHCRPERWAAVVGCRPRRALVPGRFDALGLRRSQDSGRAAAGRQGRDARAQGGSARVLRPCLPRARRKAHRPSVADSAPGRRRRQGANPARLWARSPLSRLAEGRSSDVLPG